MLARLESLLRGRRVNVDDLKTALQSVERDRRKSRVDMRRWERQRRQLLERLKKSRRDRNQVEVDYLWDELKGHRTVGQDIRREARSHNMQGIALRRSIRALEQLERSKDRESARELLDRIQRSGVLERLAVQRDAEADCLSEMSAILEDFGGGRDDEVADPEKAMFLAELDAIDEKERGGAADDAAEREQELLDRFQSIEPEPE